jgi:hypothetical protein
MMIARGKSKNIFILFLFVNITGGFLVALLFHHQPLNYSTKNYLSKLDLPLILRSNCSCRKEIVKIKNYTSDFSRPLCDLYKVLRRGNGQKVLSYSLYGSDPLYYSHIKEISKQVTKYYPGWTIRIYYDKSVNQSIICEYECLKDEVTGNYTDNIDFCNINQIPFGNPIETWDAQYMHSMKWRFLPVGDPFVDMFMSRDLDSWIVEREVSAVNEWINSNTLLHAMRGILFY